MDIPEPLGKISLFNHSRPGHRTLHRRRCFSDGGTLEEKSRRTFFGSQEYDWTNCSDQPAEVTRKRFPSNPPNSGLGIIVLCPDTTKKAPWLFAVFLAASPISFSVVPAPRTNYKVVAILCIVLPHVIEPIGCF